ncbi:MAG: hypothetical protein SP1CHLAM54_06920 [Chlamydiia bacterium]|nr:hypothetical protein [Chlamydiia bacterium]MCH9615598.1 hypothetical protein [Chlamydiia bacterium]MCH9628999.1 hypothetical protein [Chlamydiia bacterium]
MSQKKIFDPIHRFIHVDELEAKLIKSVPFQRLHFIHQLGAAFYVYPGGNHKRFDHSLGVMELATRMYDQLTISESSPDFMPDVGSSEHLYWRKIVRVAALCHDLGHLPFSHAAERWILGEKGHEKWTAKIIESAYLEPVWNDIDPNRDVKSDVLKVSVGMPTDSIWEKLLSQIVIADFFGADRIDYLVRDSHNTGLPYGGSFDYHQLFEMLRILPFNGSLELGVEEGGLESCEALLTSRYFMHKRLCQYPAVKSYGFHIARFIKTCFEDTICQDLDSFLRVTDNEVMAELSIASRDADHPGHYDALCLTMQKDRFKAVPFLSGIPDLPELPEGMYGIEEDPTPKTNLSLTFPVQRKDGSVVSGETLSELKIPQNPTHWIFVAADYAEDIYCLT